jgi:hypothetical protein
MANKVEAALGTQQRFTANPQGVYEKRLGGLSIIPSAAGSQESQLARAFGLLGDSLTKEAQSKQTRQQKVGIAEADRIARGTSDKDMKDLTAIDILQTYGDHTLSDNPYAVATVEKMRGTYFGARVKDEYNTWRQSQEPTKNADEEIARFNKFHQEAYGKAVSKTSDPTAFQKGFFESHIADQADFAGKRLGELEVERKQIATGSIQASLGGVTSKARLMAPEDLTKAASDVFADTRLTGFSIPERVKMAREFAIDLVQATGGDYAKIEAMADKVVIGSKPDGTPVRLSDNLNMHDISQMAEQKTSQVFGEKVQKSLEDLQGMTKEEANAKYAEWQQSDPHWFNVMIPFRDNVYNYHKSQEAKKLAAKFASWEQEHIKAQSSSILKSQYRSFLAGETKDASGKVVAASYGDLPKITYKHRDKDGNLVDKTKDWTVEEVNSFVDEQLKAIMSNPNTDSQRKTAESMKLLDWGPASHYKDSVKMQLNNAIDTMTVDKLPTNDNGQAQLSDQLQSAMQMYQTDPEMFYKMMGADVSHKLETIQLLSQANSGDLKQAVGLYAQGRDRAKDKAFTKESDLNVMDRLATASLSGFLDLAGNSVSIKTGLAGNRSVMERVEGLAKWLAYTGMDPSEAVESAKAAAQKTHYVWKDTAIPRSIFNGINSPDRVKVGQQVLEYYLEKFVGDTRADPKNVTTTFDVNRGVFRITGGGGYAHYNLNDIAYSGNYLLSQPQETPVAVTLEEARELRGSPETLTSDDMRLWSD